MIYIKKNSCPEDIQKDIDFQKEKSEWNDILEVPDKEQVRILREEFFDKLNKERLREALVKEQHGLCVYCMSRIENTAESTVLEHWYPLSKSKEMALQYENLFASCYGGQKETVKGVHRICCCDAKKHDASITVDPCNERMMENIIYYSDGRIDFSESYATPKIRNTLRRNLRYNLGLNGSVKNDGTMIADTTTELVKKRKDAYEAAEDMLMVLEGDNELSPERVEEIIADMQAQDIWDEYIGVTMFVLRQGI